MTEPRTDPLTDSDVIALCHCADCAGRAWANADAIEGHVQDLLARGLMADLEVVSVETS